MEIDELVRRLGGVATRAALEPLVGRAELERALTSGRLSRVARGRFVLPELEGAPRAAHALKGVLSHESAALQHGWPVLTPPGRPVVTVPVHRRLSAARTAGVEVRRSDLLPDETIDRVTTPERTLLDCLRALPFASALAVADSALRVGRAHGALRRAGRDARGPGSRQARRVTGEATELAANPFESALRAASLEVRGLAMRPQVPLWHGAEFLGRPDLVDPELGIIAEADSFAWHGSRSGLVRDARRYNAMVTAGWLVLRFTWEDVVGDPERVKGVLGLATERRCQ